MPCFPFKVYSDLPKRCFGKKQDNKLLINWPTGDVNVMMFDVQLLKKKGKQRSPIGQHPSDPSV